VALIVQKYGGTSVADPDRMRAVAENVQITKRHGHDVVVVVSAMGKATDSLIALATQVSGTRPGREMDMLLTTGERVSAALLTMALADLGIAAVSFTGSQVGIITDTVHGKAKIIEVKGDRVRQALADGKVAVVAGFQGVSTDKEITTMGRGASDLTASALAKALDADACEIYTDVTGVFSADPRIVPRARKLARISFDEMLEMAGAGSKVLALRSVEFARNHGVALHVRSAFTWEPGTWVTDEPAGSGDNPLEGSMEDPIISGVVTDASESKVTVLGVPDRPGVSASLFEPLAAANVNVDMIVQNTSTDGTTDISFTVPSADMGVAEDIVLRVAKEIGAAGVSHDDGIAKVSLVGAGMKTTPGIAAKMFRTLADEDVNIEMISTSTIRISVVVAAGDLERAARSLHSAFGLDTGSDYAAPLPERR
jgi:aspartate kinase